MGATEREANLAARWEGMLSATSGVQYGSGLWGIPAADTWVWGQLLGVPRVQDQTVLQCACVFISVICPQPYC